MAKKKKSANRLVNKKARFDYEILDTIEAGVVLTGPEVKSLRLGRGSLVDAFIQIRQGQAYLVNMTIPRYEFTDFRDYDATRTRKLLLHKKEIYSLNQKTDGQNLSLIPVEIYPKAGKFKVLIGLGRGRKQYSKKELLKRRDQEREIKRELKQKLR